MRHKLPHMEMHVSHACNLKCAYCTHYCDIGYGGLVKHDEGGEWLRQWAGRIDPGSFHLLGGEPLLNPELGQYVQTLADCFPSAKRAVVTNGILLRKLEDALPLLIDTGTRLHVSLHPVSREQAPQLRDGIRYIDSWMKKGLLLYVRHSAWSWSMRYRNTGTAIQPYADGNPEQSLAICGRTINLHQGKLWKCPQLAFLPMIHDKLEHKELWEPYLDYLPLAPDAPDADLERLIQGEPSCCGMCPAEHRFIPFNELMRLNPNLTVVKDRRSLLRSIHRAWNRRKLQKRQTLG